MNSSGNQSTYQELNNSAATSDSSAGYYSTLSHAFDPNNSQQYAYHHQMNATTGDHYSQHIESQIHTAEQNDHAKLHRQHLQQHKFAFRTFSRRLQLSTLLLIPMFTLITFTEMWWTTFALLSLLGCIAVYYRAAKKNQRWSIIMFFALVVLNLFRSAAVVIASFTRIAHLSSYEIVMMSLAAFDAALFNPICLYFTFWLLKSISFEILFLQSNTQSNKGYDTSSDYGDGKGDDDDDF